MGRGRSRLRMRWMWRGRGWDGWVLCFAAVWLAKQAWVLTDWAFERSSLPWKWNGQLLRCFVLGCGPCHPQAWISDKECFKPWGGVRIRFVALCFLFLCALYRLFGDCCFCMQSSPSMLLGHWIIVCACMCVFYLLSAQRLYPTKPWPRVSCVCMGDNTLWMLAAQPGLVQVLCVCVREKQVGWVLTGLTRDPFPPVKDVTGSHVVALSLSSISISLSRSPFLSPSSAISIFRWGVG